MGFLKAYWRWILFGVVALASLGGAAWAFVAGSSVNQQMQQVSELVSKVKGHQARPVNLKAIDAKKAEIEARKVEFEKLLDAALAMQQYNPFYEDVAPDGTVKPALRQTVRPGVLPKPERPADAIAFKSAYEAEFKKLAEKLQARSGPTPEEIENERIQINTLRAESRATEGGSAWGPPTTPTEQPPTASDSTKKLQSLPELLKVYADARAAEKVAMSVHMYIDAEAFGIHPLVNDTGAPNAVDIWQAQMSLWIQQDMAAALARCNEERAAELRKQSAEDRAWVAYLPVKRLIACSIDDALGDGGGSGLYSDFAESFTGMQNNDKRFVVPIQLKLIVEEAYVMKLLDHICRVGFYTPISVAYSAVKPDPVFETYIYGDEPVVELTLDLEGYYFRKVFDQWIPKELEMVLRTPGADREGGARR